MSRSHPFNVLLWDHDGVLVDTERLYFESTREVLGTLGVDLTPELYRQLFLVEARGAWHLAGGVSAAQLAELKRERGRRYTQRLLEREVLIPGMLELVAELGQRFRMAIVTSSHRDHFDAIHTRTGLDQLVELILAREDYVQAKPEPEPYLTALARLGVDGSECLVIEDSERGLSAAKAAGLACWVVPSELTASSRFEAADRRFDSHAALAQALRAL